MKIVFLIPPSSKKKIPDRIFGCNYAFFFQHNIFLLGIATYLKSMGHEVEIVDCIIEKSSLEQILERNSMYCFYSVFLSRKVDLQAASYIEKELGRDIPIVFLGSDPTYFPEIYLTSSNRFVVRGEPEISLRSLVEKFPCVETVKGVSWRKQNGEVVHNPPQEIIKDLDTLPLPERTLLRFPYRYYNPKFYTQPSTTLLTSRGCSFKCYYCVPNSLSFARELEWKRWYGKKPPVSLRSPENVLKEFDMVRKEGYKSILILDDEFIWGKDRTIEIMNGIESFNLELGILARPDMLTDKDLVKWLAKGGVRYVDMGVESFSQEILDYVGKNLKVECIGRAVELLRQNGIQPEINILLGSCPLETEDTIKETDRKIKEIKAEIVHYKICSPFPGTDFYYRAKKEGWMVTPEYIPIDPAAESLISYPHLPRRKLIKWVKHLYRTHYFSLPFIAKQILKTHSLGGILKKARTAFNMFKNIFLP